MNKLITTPNGGFPLTSNDLRYIDESVRDAFKGILSLLYPNTTLLNSAVILSGCNKVFDGTFYTIFPGYISIGGEVCYFPGIASILLFEGHYWEIDVDYDVAGEKIFKNGSTHQTYQTRVAKITLGIPSFPVGYTSVLNTPTATVMIQQKLKANCVWANLPDATYENPSPAGYPKYLKDVSGFVHLKGVWNSTGPGPDDLIGRLPSGFRPAEDMQFSIWNGAHQRQIIIKSDGDINFVGAETQTVRLYELPPFKAG